MTTRTSGASTSERYLVISADCHAGPQSPEGFQPYVDPEHREAFD